MSRRAIVLGIVLVAAGVRAAESLLVEPETIHLVGQRSRQQLLVTGARDNGTLLDLTRAVRYRITDPAVATVSDGGAVLARGDGECVVEIAHGESRTRAHVRVSGYSGSAPIDFRTEVIAALSRGGCNQGVCHGSPQGKNGFRLSLRGFDPDLDFFTLGGEARGRRIDLVTPRSSLVLLKPTGKVPHEGGIRFGENDPAYQVLSTWIEEGCRESAQRRQVTRLELLPSFRVLHSSTPEQQIVVGAFFDDDTVRDVTELSVFTSNDDDTASVSPDGLVRFARTGEVAVLVRYLDKLASVRLTYVHDDPEFTFTTPAEVNFVDRLVFAKHCELHLETAPLAADAVFLRRVYLDVIGVPPELEEAQEFLDSDDPRRREKLIDQLLERREYASFWALKWADVMRGNREKISKRGVHGLHRYLVRHFEDDVPFDEFAREILTSLGNTIRNPAANFYRIARTPTEAAESMSQLFLGVRIQCAKCHNHPYEAITQKDYYGLAAFFARVRQKGLRIGHDDESIYLSPDGEVKYPVTGKTQPAVAFGSSPGKQAPGEDRRERLADWMVDAGNPYFARSTVNRIWYQLFRRGIVEPVDDLRASNPPSNDELLDALAKEFVRGGYRFKPLIRTIVNSSTYQLDSASAQERSEISADAEKYFARAIVTKYTAEQILDAICTATGVPENFAGHPIGTRAIELAEGATDHHFLKAFSRPVRDVSCDCARETDPSLNEVVHLLNNPDILRKLTDPGGRLARWLAAGEDTPAVVELIYLATLSRRPTAAEQVIALNHVERVGDRAAGLQDLQHALMNSNEFLLRH